MGIVSPDTLLIAIPIPFAGSVPGTKDDHSIITQEERLWPTLCDALACNTPMLAGDLVSPRCTSGRDVVYHVNAIAHEHD